MAVVRKCVFLLIGIADCSLHYFKLLFVSRKSSDFEFVIFSEY